MRPKQKLKYQIKRRLIVLEKQNLDLRKENAALMSLKNIILEENKKQKAQNAELKRLNEKYISSKKIFKELFEFSRKKEKELNRINEQLKFINKRNQDAQKILLKAVDKQKSKEKELLEMYEELKSAEEELRQSNTELFTQKKLIEKKSEELEFMNNRYLRSEKILVKAYKTLKDREEKLTNMNKQLKANDHELMQINYSLNEQKLVLEKTLLELKSTQLQLIQTEKDSSISRLAAGFAHEINNPLNFIYGGVKGMESFLAEIDEDLRAKLFPFTNAIKIGVERSSEIIKLIGELRVSKKTEFQDCNINSIIHNSVKILKNTIEKDINILEIFEQKEINVFAEQSQLYQLFFNVLQNAEQAIEGKGEIIIRTSSDKERVKIIIEDSGKGIDIDEITKIMDPFYTTKEPGKGYGLGLFLSNSIVKQHRGTISLKSEENKYTKVTIILPKNREDNGH